MRSCLACSSTFQITRTSTASRRCGPRRRCCRWEEGLDFRVALAGKSCRQRAPEFEAARERLGARVVHFGCADEVQYAALLQQADVVVSTALHEFFGVAVVEAIYCGCFPVLPHRLTYPELIPARYHEDFLYEDFEGLLARLR